MAEAPDAGSHLRVFLVVVDATAEMRVALRYAALRARHTNGRVALLHVIEQTDLQHWMALETLMREERREEAERLMEDLAGTVGELQRSLPVVHIREGSTREELLALIDEDPTISILILAAGTGPDGPGPLVSALSGKLISKLRIPVTIVPGNLTDSEIDALS
jgi:nucleotide-binding universal stress UspA family protein